MKPVKVKVAIRMIAGESRRASRFVMNASFAREIAVENHCEKAGCLVMRPDMKPGPDRHLLASMVINWFGFVKSPAGNWKVCLRSKWGG